MNSDSNKQKVDSQQNPSNTQQLQKYGKEAEQSIDIKKDSKILQQQDSPKGGKKQQKLVQKDIKDQNDQDNEQIKYLQKFSSGQEYLIDQFGQKFINFVQNLQKTPQPDEEEIKFNKNYKFLYDKKSDLQFPNYKQLPQMVKEIFEYIKKEIKKQDLKDILEGQQVKDNIINAYIKLMEKINLLLLYSSSYYQLMGNKQQIDPFSPNFPPLKILYLDSSFHRKVNNYKYRKACQQDLANFFNYDLALMPFFFSKYQGDISSRILLVVINVAQKQVDLWDRERENDNYDISNTVLNMLELAFQYNKKDFNEDDYEGETEEIQFKQEEDMIVFICYIIECITFGNQIEIEKFNIEYQRQRLVNRFLTLLEFK